MVEPAGSTDAGATSAPVTVNVIAWPVWYGPAVAVTLVTDGAFVS